MSATDLQTNFFGVHIHEIYLCFFLQVRGPFEKFVNSPYYSESELRVTSILMYFSHLISNSSTWSLPFRFSNQNIVCISHLSHTCYMLHQSHPLWFDHPNNIWWCVKVMKLLMMQSSPAPCNFLPFLLSILYSDFLSQCSSLCVRAKFHSHTKQQVKLQVCIF